MNKEILELLNKKNIKDIDLDNLILLLSELSNIETSILLLLFGKHPLLNKIILAKLAKLEDLENLENRAKNLITSNNNNIHLNIIINNMFISKINYLSNNIEITCDYYIKNDNIKTITDKDIRNIKLIIYLPDFETFNIMLKS